MGGEVGNIVIEEAEGKQTHGSSSISRAAIICEYATQVITFTTWLIVMSRKRGYTMRCPHCHKNIPEKALCYLWLYLLPDHSQAHDFYSKKHCLYVCERKKECSRGDSFLTAKYSYKHEYGLSLKPVAVTPSTTKKFPRRFCVLCGFIVPPTTLRGMISTQKSTACTYVKGRKSARGGIAF